MYKIALLPDEERHILILNTAAKKGLNAAIVEKDFWVCFTLDYLFHKSQWRNKLAFKGGTSLSKVYNLIERFSEDIDLILDWRVLGYSVNEPWEERSNTKQQKFIDDSRNRLFNFLANDFLPSFKDEVGELLQRDINVFITEEDAGTVHFEYPSSFPDDSILRVIRLEIGALAAWTPTQVAGVTSYAAEEYPRVFEKAGTEIVTTTAERSFWEKATILHQEALRPEGSVIPDRYSRHYYDLYCMANSAVKDNAMAMPELLTQVAEFKAKFYPRNWAHYELARIGTLKLLPAEHSVERLKADYAHMRSMIYGAYPSFEEILNKLESLEKEINIQ